MTEGPRTHAARERGHNAGLSAAPGRQATVTDQEHGPTAQFMRKPHFLSGSWLVGWTSSPCAPLCVGLRMFARERARSLGGDDALD